MSLKKYRIIDLIVLCVLGIVLEFAGTWLINAFIPFVIPTFTVTFIIMLAAIIRWGPVGIVMAPLLALSTYLAGILVAKNLNDHQFPPNYFVDLGYALVTGVMIPVFIKFGYEKAFDTFFKRVSSCIGLYILGAIVGGLLMGVYGYNIFISMLGFLAQQLMSLVITIIFIEMLYRQETLQNMKTKFLRQKRELEEEKKYYQSREKG